ncbi:MAG: hypothetical protein ACFB9M_16925 [Myxococcota bacterium]
MLAAWVVCFALAVPASDDPLSPADLDMIQDLLSTTSTVPWPAPDATLRPIPSARSTELLARTFRQTHDVTPISSVGPFGTLELRTEHVEGFFVEPLAGGWLDLPPEVLGPAVLTRGGALSRADLDGIELFGFGSGAERVPGHRLEAFVSARTADRNTRGGVRASLAKGPWSISAAGSGEGGSDLTIASAPNGDPQVGVDAQPFLRARGAGLVSAGYRPRGTPLELRLVGAVDGRSDDPDRPGPRDVIRGLGGIHLQAGSDPTASVSTVSGNSMGSGLALRASYQAARFEHVDTATITVANRATVVQAVGRLALSSAVALHTQILFTEGEVETRTPEPSPRRQDVDRLEGLAGVEWSHGLVSGRVLAGASRHGFGGQSVTGWTGKANLRFGRRLFFEAAGARGIDGLGAVPSPRGFATSPRASARGSGTLGLSGERGFLRLAAGALYLEPEGEAGETTWYARSEGALELVRDVRLLGAFGGVGRFQRLTQLPLSRDLELSGFFARGSARWDPNGGTMEVHVSGRAGTPNNDFDFLSVGAAAALDVGAGFWLRVSIENAADTALPPELFRGQGFRPGIDIRAAVSWIPDF